MPDAVKAQPRADVDPVFNDQITAIQTQAAAESAAVLTGTQAQWMVPKPQGWTGDLFDLVGMSKMFDRSKSNEWFAQSIADPTKPGTVGDQAVTTTQIDLLAAMERAWRNRHTMRRPRSMMHAMARKAGHGSQTGPLVQAQLEHIRGMVRKSKGQGPT